MKTSKLQYPNSAGRLLIILNQLKPNQAAGGQLIPLMFGSAKTNEPKSIGLKSLLELHILYAEFIPDLDDADIPNTEKNVLVKGLSSLESMMYPSSVGEGMRGVTEAEKALLEVCATRLPKEKVIDDEDLVKVQESIQTLKKSISELPPESILRNVLLELIRLSEDSINRFNIYGAKGLKKAFKSMLAEVAEIYMQNDEDVSDIKDSDAWGNALKHLKLFDFVASKAMQYSPLLERTTLLLS